MEEINSKWNARYAYASKQLPEPAQVLVRGSQFIPSRGIAIDIACGLGGNAFYLLNRGLTVFAWDISETAIDSINKRKSAVLADVRDVTVQPPLPQSADLIVVSRFLDRGLCAHLSDALRPNGILFYQTFTAGLSNPDYMLKPNELPDLFASLTPCYCDESAVNEKGFAQAQFIGRKEVL